MPKKKEGKAPSPHIPNYKSETKSKKKDQSSKAKMGFLHKSKIKPKICSAESMRSRRVIMRA